MYACIWVLLEVKPPWDIVAGHELIMRHQWCFVAFSNLQTAVVPPTLCHPAFLSCRTADDQNHVSSIPYHTVP